MAVHVEILVEELSMESALRLIIPKIVPQMSFTVYPYQCKQDLLGKLPDRLRGYSSWLPRDWQIMVIVDRDDDKCDLLKNQLEAIARRANLRTRTQGGPHFQLTNRLAIEELEAWFFGDWAAVRQAYPKVSSHIPAKQSYRDSDRIPHTWESLERILQRAGYFKAGLRKIELARAIAEHMEPNRNRSRSFQLFRDALLDVSR